jgi:hypothetical protein
MITVKRQIYSLKKRFGTSVDFYREIDGEPDPESGVISQQRFKFRVDEAVYLDQSAITRGILTKVLNQLAGIQDTIDVAILIDGDDLPCGFVPVLTDYVIIDHQRYDIKTIKQVDDYESLYLELCEYSGSITYEIRDKWLKDKLTIVEVLNVIHTSTFVENLNDVVEFTENISTE